MEIAKYFNKVVPSNDVNMICSSEVDYTGHYAFSIVSRIHKGDWIVDSGASVHICCDASLMQNLTSLKEPQKIFLPTGAVQWVHST